MHHLDYYKQLDQARLKISQLPPQYRKDLLKMWHTVQDAYIAMDKEMVECRRTRRITSKYKDLEAKFQTLIPSLEKRITLALLY